MARRTGPRKLLALVLGSTLLALICIPAVAGAAAEPRLKTGSWQGCQYSVNTGNLSGTGYIKGQGKLYSCNNSKTLSVSVDLQNCSKQVVSNCTASDWRTVAHGAASGKGTSLQKTVTGPRCTSPSTQGVWRTGVIFTVNALATSVYDTLGTC